EKDKKLLAQNPLIEGNQKLVRSVTRVFRKDQEMYVFLHAYEPEAQTTQRLVASVSFYRGKVKACETAPLEIKEGLAPESRAMPVCIVPLTFSGLMASTCISPVLFTLVRRNRGAHPERCWTTG